jgi:hypothetical protein
VVTALVGDTQSRNLARNQNLRLGGVGIWSQVLGTQPEASTAPATQLPKPSRVVTALVGNTQSRDKNRGQSRKQYLQLRGVSTQL